MKFHRFSAVALLSMCLMWLPTAALAAYYTNSVSEEDPPAACDIGDAIYGATCEGDYCDNTRLYCDETNYPVSYRYWTSNFSEESGGSYCGANEIMSGISCSGSYCDNVSIECSGISSTRYNCQWIGPFSEEQGFAYFGGQYANGMWCTGDYCDNHYYLVCNFG
jgi:hypothetical protein